MTKEDFANIVEFEGWFYALTEVNPSRLKDAALAEALVDAQEAFQILADMTPDATLDLSFLDDDEGLFEELDFDDD